MTNKIDLADVANTLSDLAQRVALFRRLTLSPTDRLRVLLVDRNIETRQAISLVLSAEHDVFEADGFAEALVCMATSTFDAIVSDEALDGVGSGMALLAEVRKRWPSVRRVLCTADLARLARSLDTGAVQRVVERPIESGRLLAALR